MSKIAVSLFVRLWVEMSGWCLSYMIAMQSASSWGCELKYQLPAASFLPEYGQPLREAVSWNVLEDEYEINGSTSASSWGCELKLQNCAGATPEKGQPLREAVSWNLCSSVRGTAGILSASSWGCELKYLACDLCYFHSCQPLREAVSWNVRESNWWRYTYVSLFVRLWVEMLNSCKNQSWLRSASSWGCELK